jgi:hypothetical protein
MHYRLICGTYSSSKDVSHDDSVVSTTLFRAGRQKNWPYLALHPAHRVLKYPGPTRRSPNVDTSERLTFYRWWFTKFTKESSLIFRKYIYNKPEISVANR